MNFDLLHDCDGSVCLSGTGQWTRVVDAKSTTFVGQMMDHRRNFDSSKNSKLRTKTRQTIRWHTAIRWPVAELVIQRQKFQSVLENMISFDRSAAHQKLGGLYCCWPVTRECASSWKFHLPAVIMSHSSRNVRGCEPKWNLVRSYAHVQCDRMNDFRIEPPMPSAASTWQRVTLVSGNEIACRNKHADRPTDNSRALVVFCRVAPLLDAPQRTAHKNTYCLFLITQRLFKFGQTQRLITVERCERQLAGFVSSIILRAFN